MAILKMQSKNAYGLVSRLNAWLMQRPVCLIGSPGVGVGGGEEERREHESNLCL